jgi:hypothetical protein
MSIYKQLAASVLRWALTIFFAYLVRKGMVSEADASVWIPEMAVGIVGVLAPLLWGLWQKIQNRLALQVAVDLPPGAPLINVKAVVEDMKADLTIGQQVNKALETTK